MMRHKNRYSISVRKANNEIETITSDVKNAEENKKIRNFPFIRGIFNFIITGTATAKFLL